MVVAFTVDRLESATENGETILAIPSMAPSTLTPIPRPEIIRDDWQSNRLGMHNLLAFSKDRVDF